MLSCAARFALIFIGGAIYLGLAIWGEGWGGFFAEPALIALAVVMFAISFVALFAGGSLSTGLREDRGNRWVIAAIGVIGLALGYVPAWCDRFEIWTIDGAALRWLGVVVFAVGSVLRLWPVFVLGDRFSGLVAIQPGHRLATEGIYRRIRHPSYLGLLLGSLGWALAFRSAIGVGLVALLLPPLLARITAEERLLRDNFGAEYEAYRARTARLIPGLY